MAQELAASCAGEALSVESARRHDPRGYQTAGSLSACRPPETGDRRLGSSPGARYEKALVAINNATRLAYVEVLSDKKQATTVGFLLRAVAWFNGQGITCRRALSDNGSAYRSKTWQAAWATIGLTPKRTRMYTPSTNDKAERIIKTLLAEWAYAMAFQNSEDRNRWLSRYLEICSGRRWHMALAGRIPNHQLNLLRATE